MPKQTFFNLHEDKRERIEAAAVKEFGEFGFHGARLNNIVQRAGIAKGSFYQYFDNLEDLFLHVVKSTSETKMNIIHEVLKQYTDADLFTKFAKIQKAGMYYYSTASKDMLNMLEHVYNNSKLLEKDEFKIWLRSIEEMEYYPLIDKAIASGEIDTDRDFAYVVISNTGKMIRQYILAKKKSERISDMFNDEKVVDEAIDQFISFLQQGLKPQKRSFPHE